MQPYQYYLKIGQEIKKSWAMYHILFKSTFVTDGYPFLGVPAIRCGIPFNNPPDHFRFYGCNFGDQAVFVPWMNSSISAFNTFPNRIAVSFGFSGCYMAKYYISGRCYVSHIQSGFNDCKHIWNSFCDHNRREIKIHALFRPTNINDEIYAYKQRQKDRGVECTIAGVIMPNDDCYAVLVNVQTHLPIYITQIDKKYSFFIPNE